MRRQNRSSLISGNSEETPESIIDRNLNMIPHFKSYESEKRKLMKLLLEQ
jgi:hypothetical protein